MTIISHRGNLNGPNPKMENHPDYIDEALNKGFLVEVDVWLKGNQWWLGHDEPTYKFPKRMWSHEMHGLILHCKNAAALENLVNKGNEWIHYFWHQEDNYTLTSFGKIWVYPGQPLLYGSICVSPEKGYVGNIKQCHGICTDFPLKRKTQ